MDRQGAKRKVHGIEHRPRKEEVEEQFIREAKDGWRVFGGCSENHR